MKVFVVHPNYDYAVHSVHATMEGAKAEVQRAEEAAWANYSSIADFSDPLSLGRESFFGEHYIAEIEVQP